jgi:hypothetical protein
MSTPERIKTAKTLRLQTVASKSSSYREALRRLGVQNGNGRNIATLRKAFRANHVSTKHFV